MNIYIQDKLGAFDEKVNNTYEFFNATDGGGELQFTINEIDVDGVRNFIEQSLTDYHNHIVEKILHYYQENILYIGNEVPESLARISDMDRYVMLGLPSDIQKILRDTNK